METLRDLFEHVVGTFPARKELLRVKAGKGWRTFTVKEFERATRECAARLSRAGVVPGDRVALFAENRPEWHIIDFACHLLGAVSVPIYATLPAAQVRYIVADAGAKLLFVSGKERARAAIEATAGLETKLIAIDPGLAEGIPVLGDLPLPSKKQRVEPPPLTGDDLASLIYTSGTTGDPKGVMLTHRNFMSQVNTVKPLYPITERDISMSFLPLSHVYERTVDYVFLYYGVQINYVESIERVPMQLLGDPADHHGLGAAPVRALLHQDHLQDPAEGGAKRRLFEWGLRVGRKVREAEWRGEKACAVRARPVRGRQGAHLLQGDGAPRRPAALHASRAARRWPARWPSSSTSSACRSCRGTGSPRRRR